MYENREVFPNAPLEFVAGEVRFPFAPQLSKDEAFEALGAALKLRFPLPERENRPQGVSISAEGMKPVEAHVLWRFLNRRRTASVSVTPNSLTLETTDYGEYEEFRTLLAEALRAIDSLGAVVGVERVGLRYIDELRIPIPAGRPDAWSGYLNEVLLAPLTLVEGYEPVGIEGVIRLATGPGRGLLMRYASLEGTGVVGRAPLKRRSQPIDGPFVVLDVDSYWSEEGYEVPEFVPEDVLSTFDLLHEPVGVLFLRVITEKFKIDVREKAASMTAPASANPNVEMKETAGSGQISYGSTADQTAAGSAVLAHEYGLLRDRIGVLNEDVNEAHRQAQRYDLDDRARTEAKKSVPTLLEELSVHRGMAWRDIARLVGVSVSAVRKWRHERAAAPENRLALAKLAAFLDLLEGFMVEDPASWLELPMVDGYTVRHMDLYEGGRPDLLLDLVGIRSKETAALDLFDPDWRTRYRSDFEVFEAGDGKLSIRKR